MPYFSNKNEFSIKQKTYHNSIQFIVSSNDKPVNKVFKTLNQTKIKFLIKLTSSSNNKNESDTNESVGNISIQSKFYSFVEQ